jgi:Tol biopolymer transport system component
MVMDVATISADGDAMTKQKLLRAASAFVLCLAAFATHAKPSRADWRSLTGGPLPSFLDVSNVKISPNSRQVVFEGRRVAGSPIHLYAAPITGTTTITLSAPLVASGSIELFSFSITPDSRYVIYLADPDGDARNDLYRVPIEGGLPVKLNGAGVANGNVGFLLVDPNNQYVVYIAKQETSEVFELFSVPIGGGDSVKLNSELAQQGGIGTFKIASIANRVIYSADAETDGAYELYSVPIAGGPVLKLSPSITRVDRDDRGIYDEFDVNPAFDLVVFIARESGKNGGRLYSIPAAGGARTQLSFDLSNRQQLLGFRISPASDRVVFNVLTRMEGFTMQSGRGTLHSVSSSGGGAAEVTEPADPTFGVEADDFQFTTTGKHVIYQFQKTMTSAVRFESTALSDGDRTVLYQPGVNDPEYRYSRSSSDGKWIMFQRGLRDASLLVTLPPSGGNPISHGIAEFEAFTPDSKRVLYTRVLNRAANFNALYSAKISGGDERNLSGSENNGYVADVAVSEDGSWIVYTFFDGKTWDVRVSDGRPAETPPIAAFRVRLPLVGRD